MWFSSFLSLLLSPGPDSFRALRTATRQNNWMKRNKRKCSEKNHAYAFVLSETKIKKQNKQDPRIIVQAAVQQITLYLRGLNFRKVTG